MANNRIQEAGSRAPKKFQKEKIKRELEILKIKLGDLQNLLYAEGKHAMLIIIQGMDASGKDGAVKNVFEAINPMGCKVIAFKKPSDLEMKHDFLWRVHQQVPEKGMVHIFNRSHYEDVLIQRVHKWVDEKVVTQRFEQINNFEKLLKENGTLVIKFFLNVSKEEQLSRLEERLSDPTKMWKHNENDLKEREFWDNYMNAYEDVFEKCSKSVAWNIIPSDQNWYKEYLMAKRIVEEMEGLKMKFPILLTNSKK
jgi:PPK2 family polyphosphate:nucleotide phosphotransferase